MSDFYCGVKKIPKDKKRGTMKECVEAGKVSYYGVKKIDSKLLETVGKKNANPKDPDSYKIKIMGLKGKVKNLTSKIKTEKDATKKKKFEQQLKKVEAEKNKFSKGLKKLSSGKNNKKPTKKKGMKVEKATKKSWRDGSMKRTRVVKSSS